MSKKNVLPLVAILLVVLGVILVVLGFVALPLNNGGLFASGILIPPILGLPAFILAIIGLARNPEKEKPRFILSLTALIGSILIVPLIVWLWIAAN